MNVVITLIDYIQYFVCWINLNNYVPYSHVNESINLEQQYTKSMIPIYPSSEITAGSVKKEEAIRNVPILCNKNKILVYNQRGEQRYCHSTIVCPCSCLTDVTVGGTWLHI